MPAPESSPRNSAPGPASSIDSPLVPASIVLSVFCFAVNRGLLPALPGTRIGLDRTLVVTYALGSLASQLLVALLSVLTIRLVILGITNQTLGLVPRLLALPLATGALFLWVVAASNLLEAELGLILGLLGSMVAVVLAPRCLLRRTDQTAALVLSTTALACLAEVVARSLLYLWREADTGASLGLIRSLTTAAAILDGVALVVVGRWLVLGARHRVFWSVVVGVMVLVVLTLVLWPSGSHSVGFARLLFLRSLTALLREPRPLLSAPYLYLANLGACGLALGLAVRPRFHDASLRGGIALLLMARYAADIPMHAAWLVTGSLLVAQRQAKPPAQAATAAP